METPNVFDLRGKKPSALPRNVVNIMKRAGQSLEYWRQEMLGLGYEVKTTFWADFTIAEFFGDGTAAVKDTFERAFKEWKTDKTYVTELVLVLNHKIWEHHALGHEELARTYDALWERADLWCCENLKGDDLSYYYETTD